MGATHRRRAPGRHRADRVRPQRRRRDQRHAARARVDPRTGRRLGRDRQPDHEAARGGAHVRLVHAEDDRRDEGEGRDADRAVALGAQSVEGWPDRARLRPLRRVVGAARAGGGGPVHRPHQPRRRFAAAPRAGAHEGDVRAGLRALQRAGRRPARAHGGVGAEGTAPERSAAHMAVGEGRLRAARPARRAGAVVASQSLAPDAVPRRQLDGAQRTRRRRQEGSGGGATSSRRCSTRRRSTC